MKFINNMKTTMQTNQIHHQIRRMEEAANRKIIQKKFT